VGAVPWITKVVFNGVVQPKRNVRTAPIMRLVGFLMVPQQIKPVVNGGADAESSPQATVVAALV